MSDRAAGRKPEHAPLLHDASDSLTRSAKACPVVLREAADRLEILAFRHPSAGKQLVKGTIEFGESAEAAALRELQEESGIAGAITLGSLGKSDQIDPDQSWHFIVCETPDLPAGWVHVTKDDGGLDFSFFWHPLDSPPDDVWHPNFVRALAFIRDRLARSPP